MNSQSSRIKGHFKSSDPAVWVILVNPVAGIGKTKLLWPKLERLLRQNGISYEVRFSHVPGDIIKETQVLIGQGYRNFAALGGDGTLNEMVNGIFQQSHISTNQLMIASIPGGTGNDWIKSQYAAKDLPRVVSMMAKGKYKYQDIGEVTTGSGQCSFFANLAEFGYGGLVVKHISRYKRFRGPLAYVASVVAGLFLHAPGLVRLESPQLLWEGRTFNVILALGNYAGGGMKLAPGAVLDDGLFDLITIGPLPWWKVIWNLRKLFDGTYIKLSQVRVMAVNEIKLSSKSSLPAEADGEFLGSSNEFKISLIKKAVRVLRE